MNKTFGVIGGDRRQAELARLLAEEGRTVWTSGVAGCPDLPAQAAAADVVILPLPLCREDGILNRRAGILIGQGKTPREAMEEVGAVVEGYFAAESIHQLSERVGVEMPISRCAYEVLYQGKQIRGVVAELMTRAKKDELLETAWL